MSEAPAWLAILAREQIALALLGPYPSLHINRARAIAELAVDLCAIERGEKEGR